MIVFNKYAKKTKGLRQLALILAFVRIFRPDMKKRISYIADGRFMMSDGTEMRAIQIIHQMYGVNMPISEIYSISSTGNLISYYAYNGKIRPQTVVTHTAAWIIDRLYTVIFAPLMLTRHLFSMRSVNDEDPSL